MSSLLVLYNQHGMMQVILSINIFNLKYIKLYAMSCPLAHIFFSCTPLSMNLATDLHCIFLIVQTTDGGKDHIGSSIEQLQGEPAR